MKLYSKPGACSTAVNIALHWAKQADSSTQFDIELLKTQAELKSPEFLAINPVGSVPALVDGEFKLTQNVAIMLYVSDKFPKAQLAGSGDIQQRAEAMRWLAFVNSDLHPAFGRLFSPSSFIEDETQHDAIRAMGKKRVLHLLELAEKTLASHQFLAGFRSFADAYFYMTLRWADFLKMDLSQFKNIAAFKSRMDADTAVQAALRSEGLIA